MSRIADAFAKSGQSLPDVDGASWEAEEKAAEAHLSGRVPDVLSRLPIARPEERRSADAVERSPDAVALIPAAMERAPDAIDRAVKPVAWDRRPFRDAGPDGRPPSLSADALARVDSFAITQSAKPELSAVAPGGTTNVSAIAPDAKAEALSRPSPAPAVRANDPELAAAVRRVFLSRRSRVRSAVFCSVPGGERTDVAWRAAALLADESGRKVAFVEDGSRRVVPPSAASRHGLVTWIGWHPNAPGASANGGRSASVAGVDPERSGTADDDVLGERVADLLARFDYVILSTTAYNPADVLPLAREVDGAIVVLMENETRIADAETLLQELRSSGAHLLGAILATGD